MDTWEIWYPKAAATGLLFARGRIDPTDRVLVHAPGDVITVEVKDDNGARKAIGTDLERALPSPMSLLTIVDGKVMREDIWPSEEHLGAVVMLAGGEAGILKGWWHAEDRKEWRWQIELYNSIR